MTRLRRPDDRPLARPGEGLADQGLGYDLGTLMGRRRALRFLGLGAVVLGAAAGTDDAAPRGTASTGEEIPGETAGPFPGDGSNGPDVLEQSGIVRGDIRSSFGTGRGTAGGVPMVLELEVVDLGGGGFRGAAVYVWQCDREGRYSLYSDGATEQNYLRGVQVADDGGVVRFTSIVPACYPGRWPHVHFEVYRTVGEITDAGNVLVTSQVALPEPMCAAAYAEPGYERSVPELSRLSLAGDSVFRDDGGVRQLATVTGDVAGGFRARLTVPVG